ncbi:MAG: GAF domain-containing protein [Deltaproteobacteria bacterium]|nr:GAF domain-containing protein [Deltaproteobacteria bacterium]
MESFETPRRPSTAPHDPASILRRNQKLTALLEVAKAMTACRDLDGLLGIIMRESVRTVDAERCTLFLLDRDKKQLWSKIAHGMAEEIIRLPVGRGIAGHVAQTGEILNIADAYADSRFNRETDARTGYVTRTILCVPMIGTKGVVGVVQALNHSDGPFKADDEELLMALCANAAAAIENASLYEEIERLFEGFVKASVTAIEARDPTTSGHSDRVATLCVTLLEVLPRAGGRFASLVFPKEDVRELRYAALLHDFGKVGVREHVLVKADKLYPHELQLLEQRFEQALYQAEVEYLRAKVERLEREERDALGELERRYRARVAELDEILSFIKKCNRPTVLEAGGFERLSEIARRTFSDARGKERELLTQQEARNLSIGRGSLNEAERKEIESHVTHTYNFLRQIPWTKDLARVPTIAYGHHEKIDGSGYPLGAPAMELPVQTRIMTISDIYDALTASDRPYKTALPRERAISILDDEAKHRKVDPELLEVFVAANVPKLALGH